VAEPLRGLDAARRADVGDFVVHYDRPERGLGEALAPDDDRRAGERIAREHRCKIRRRLIECDQRDRHLRGLRGLARHELEARRADAETRGQSGIGTEPRAVGVAICEGQICAGHARQVGVVRRGVKKKFAAPARCVRVLRSDHG
jgi:hypothetical protein